MNRDDWLFVRDQDGDGDPLQDILQIVNYINPCVTVFDERLFIDCQ